MVVLAVILGIVVGAVAAWLVAHARAAARYAPQLARLEAERQGALDRARSIEESDERVQALAAEALRRNNTSFLQLAETQLAPIRESLQRFGEHTQALEQKRSQAYGALFTQVQSLAESQERLRTETGNLVKALRAPHVRGRWGEMQLKRVVELAGMVAHCDFVEQTSSPDEDGRLLRPDMIVKLAGGKNVIVDAKAPLAAYLDALEAEDESSRRLHLQTHARQVRDHIGKLAAKRYWQQFAPTPEFVVMFLPDETFFRAAADEDPSLHELGPESGVLIASPMTLIALLRAIAYGWQQETVAESAREIAALGRELYERLGTFGKHLGKAGRGLETAVAAYNEAVGSLETRVLVTARKFEQRGVAGSELPEAAPIERAVRPIQAAELVAGPERTQSELLPPAADAA